MDATTMPSIIFVPQLFSNEGALHVAARRYSEARLRALQIDPNAFASSYEQEKHYPIETWIGRLENKQAKTFIIVGKSSPEGDLEGMLDQPWLGSIVLLGPKA